MVVAEWSLLFATPKFPMKRVFPRSREKKSIAQLWVGWMFALFQTSKVFGHKFGFGVSFREPFAKVREGGIWAFPISTINIHTLGLDKSVRVPPPVQSELVRGKPRRFKHLA